MKGIVIVLSIIAGVLIAAGIVSGIGEFVIAGGIAIVTMILAALQWLLVDYDWPAIAIVASTIAMGIYIFGGLTML